MNPDDIIRGMSQNMAAVQLQQTIAAFRHENISGQSDVDNTEFTGCLFNSTDFIVFLLIK